MVAHVQAQCFHFDAVVSHACNATVNRSLHRYFTPALPARRRLLLRRDAQERGIRQSARAGAQTQESLSSTGASNRRACLLGAACLSFLPAANAQ